jgi:hypothetical protein
MKRTEAARRANWMLFFCLLVAFFPAASALANCKTGDTAFTANYRGDSVLAVNLDINDYGRIHEDAENPDPFCSENALYALYHKINNSLIASPNAFKRPLDGYVVALAFAAAQRLGANGWATQDLDQKLDAVEGRYTLNFLTSCSNEAKDTCMDDYAGAASAYAWIAAYKAKRGDANTATYQNNAVQQLHNAFSAVCIHNPVTFPTGNRLTLCNGTASNLKQLGGNSVTMNMNHGYQKLPYGFGLMTSVSSALLGLKVSGMTYPWGPYEKAIATALFEEAQNHVDGGDNFEANCADPQPTGGGQWTVPGLLKKCGGGNDFDGNGTVDEDEYKARMYSLNEAYKDFGIPIPTTRTYRSDVSVSRSLFHLGISDNHFFSFGRFVTYGVHGDRWHVSPPEWMPKDYYNPIGYFEGISATGVAQGWSCDQDKPKGRVEVDLYDEFNNKVRGWANAGSESAINSLCNGGTAHRFWIQLPSYTKGRTIRAYGIDYTWVGATQLPCLQSPACSW